MAIRITLECGHSSTLKPRITPEGFTHDWEVFVRGIDNADISQYVDKVVFQLHETFPKPKRVFKEAPYVLKESGYAGFVIPICVYLKSKDEPKKIEISYDLTLQSNGPTISTAMRHSKVITNPPDDFRRKLLKGGGVVVAAPESHDKSESKASVQMVGKPKLSGTDSKKHRPAEPRSTNQFAHLFGVPIKTGSKVSPESKKPPEKSTHHKPPDKPEKSSKSKHSPHKDAKKDKPDEGEKKKEKKEAPKEKERSKEKPKRPQSPPKPDYHPPKRPQSPSKQPKQSSPPDALQKSSSPKTVHKDHKKSVSDRDKHPEKSKDPPKPVEEPKPDKKKRKHKDDRESDRKEKSRDKNRDKPKEPKTDSKKPEKYDKQEKDREKEKQKEEQKKDVKRSPKASKEGERSSSRSRGEVDKPKEQKVEKERQKHKHRKKDKKERSDDSREREKREKKDKKILEATAPSSNPLSTLLAEVDRDSSDSNSDDDEQKPPVVKEETKLERIRPGSPAASGKVKEKEVKAKREKSKPKVEDRKRKRRSDSKGDDEIPVKRENSGFSPPLEPVSSSQSPAADILAYGKEDAGEVKAKEAFESEQIAPDSTNILADEGEPPVFSEDYVSQLKDLQQKIMTLQDNQELQRVVQVIAATGQYEITRKTFDFDLCTLDRRTVQRLQQFFSGS